MDNAAKALPLELTEVRGLEHAARNTQELSIENLAEMGAERAYDDRWGTERFDCWAAFLDWSDTVDLGWERTPVSSVSLTGVANAAWEAFEQTWIDYDQSQRDGGHVK